MDLIKNQEFAEALLDRLVEENIKKLEKVLPAVEGYVQVVQVDDDLGTQIGPVISSKLYKEIVKPRHKKLFKYIKENSSAYLFFHSCGSIYEFIPDLIEIGVDILNPIQVSAKGMGSTAKLKKEFGKKIVFWRGGCDTQEILPHGSPVDVKKEVKQRIRDLAPGGGYIFSQVHNIQPDVPVKNIITMFNTALSYGKYPIK